MTNNKMDDNTITPGSGNVFADLELDNAEELLAKSKLAQEIRALIKERGLTQVRAAKILKTDQPQVSRLNTGKGVDGMSFELLFGWLTRLNRTITVTVQPAPQGKDVQGSLVVTV